MIPLLLLLTTACGVAAQNTYPTDTSSVVVVTERQTITTAKSLVPPTAKIVEMETLTIPAVNYNANGSNYTSYATITETFLVWNTPYTNSSSTLQNQSITTSSLMNQSLSTTIPEAQLTTTLTITLSTTTTQTIQPSSDIGPRAFTLTLPTPINRQLARDSTPCPSSISTPLSNSLGTWLCIGAATDSILNCGQSFATPNPTTITSAEQTTMTLGGVSQTWLCSGDVRLRALQCGSVSSTIPSSEAPSISESTTAGAEKGGGSLSNWFGSAAATSSVVQKSSLSGTENGGSWSNFFGSAAATSFSSKLQTSRTGSGISTAVTSLSATGTSSIVPASKSSTSTSTRLWLWSNEADNARISMVALMVVCGALRFAVLLL